MIIVLSFIKVCVHLSVEENVIIIHVVNSVTIYGIVCLAACMHAIVQWH